MCERQRQRGRERGEENWGKSSRREEKKRPNSRGSQPLFTKTDSRLELPLRRGVCVCILLHKSPYAYAPLDMCGRMTGGTPAEVCDLAYSGCDWSSLAPGWMTVQCQKPSVLIAPSTHHKIQKCSKGSGYDSPCQLDSHVCEHLSERTGGLRATCAEFTCVRQRSCGGRSSEFPLDIDLWQPR